MNDCVVFLTIESQKTLKYSFSYITLSPCPCRSWLHHSSIVFRKGHRKPRFKSNCEHFSQLWGWMSDIWVSRVSVAVCIGKELMLIIFGNLVDTRLRNAEDVVHTVNIFKIFWIKDAWIEACFLGNLYVYHFQREEGRHREQWARGEGWGGGVALNAAEHRGAVVGGCTTEQHSYSIPSIFWFFTLSSCLWPI